ncbi:uncharacterized protein LOC131206105 [Anopheles bellator]|uniref:uncharacterized protein LOC131206105 n=1 Tax=Anopheles bellator TaxID=139047 RepID=UPI0026482E29|nr:uncharacterized protein LOC131206105 [Anopheles bellator]XP_058054485.1 uncharacterized protein LOC131206105 [Anopheles bellator]
MVSTRQMTGATSEESCLHLFRTTGPSASSSSSANIGAASSTTSSSSSKGATAPGGGALQNSSSNHPLPNQPSAGTELRQLNLMDLPTELLDHILSYVGYKQIGHMRGISHQMNQVCSSKLNSTFQKLQNQMQTRFHTVKAKMPRRESARRNHPLAYECDILETCYMRLSLLQMTFGKHIERKHCCFFPGAILDEVYSVISYIRTTPALDRPFKVTDELFDLSTMAMEYFKEHIEPNLPDIAYFTKSTKSFAALETSSSLLSRDTSHSSSSSPPRSNMVLRKGIRKIKQGMKRYNDQLSVLRGEVRTFKRKSTEQAKTITEQQKLLTEQQKQTLEFANRLDETDKKNEELSRKFSTVLQELNKCKTELQYWRSNSPAVTSCNPYGAATESEELNELVSDQNETPNDEVALLAMGMNEGDTSLDSATGDNREKGVSHLGDNHPSTTTTVAATAAALLVPIETHQPSSPKLGQKRKYECLVADDELGAKDSACVNPPFASAPLASLVASYSSSATNGNALVAPVASTSSTGTVVLSKTSAAELTECGQKSSDQSSLDTGLPTVVTSNAGHSINDGISAVTLPSSGTVGTVATVTLSSPVSLLATEATNTHTASPPPAAHPAQHTNHFLTLAAGGNGNNSSVSNSVSSKHSSASNENTNHNKKLRRVQNKARSQSNNHINLNAMSSATNVNTKTTRSKQSEK